MLIYNLDISHYLGGRRRRVSWARRRARPIGAVGPGGLCWPEEAHWTAVGTAAGTDAADTAAKTARSPGR